MKSSVLGLGLLCCLNAFGAEADHFTHRERPLQDVSSLINERANTYLKQAVALANQSGACNETELYTNLQLYFSNHSKGELAKFSIYDPGLTRDMIPLKSSVYKDWDILDGYLLGKKSAASSPLALAPMIQMGPQRIGTDKLEHMFGMGFIYFSSHYLEGKPLHKVLKKGILMEKTALGGNVLATGVFSYGDLSANFNGMRFWNHVLQKNDDVLGIESNLGPYVACQSGKWAVVKEIDFLKYIDASMDESMNCSKFATRRGLKKFQQSLQEIDPAYTCPMLPEVNAAMVEKYKALIPGDSKRRPVSHWIINAGTNDDVSYLNEF